MKIVYIFHSCYLIEFESFSVLIDYYSDSRRVNNQWWVNDYLLHKRKRLYVLCTHSHQDHFNPEILTWKNSDNDIRYIFSKELLDSDTTKESDAVYLDKLSHYEDENLRIDAFGSTDIGGSFLLSQNGLRIFHAGDLNNWHWMEEVSKEEALMYENNFLCELELLAERVEKLHIAMFPVDPRLGKEYMRGAEQFVARIKTDYFFPMHFGRHYNKANAFAELAQKHDCLYLPITERGKQFLFRRKNEEIRIENR